MNTNLTTTATPGLTGSGNTHARLSPSDSKRWVSCTASIAFQEANAHRVRKDTGGVYADWGTAAHEFSAQVLLGQTTLAEVPEEYVEVVGLYTSHCLSKVEGAKLTSIQSCLDELESSTLLGVDHEPADRVYFVEEQLSLFYQNEQTGTADFIGIIANGGVVERFVGLDLKAGAGVLYTSAESTQLAIYMFSAIKLLEGVYQFGPETVVELAMFQPRHREGAEQQPWVISLADLATFCKEIEYHAIQAREGANRVRAKIGSTGKDVSPAEILEAAPMVRFAPSEGDGGACRWCRSSAFCPKRLAALTEDMDTPHLSAEDLLACMPDLEKAELKLPTEDRVVLTGERLGLPVLTDEYLVACYRRAKGIKKWLDDVEEFLEGRLLDGEEVPGTKLVEGNYGDRKWANEEAADTFLAGQKISADDRYTRKVISPTTAEKLLKDKLKTVARTKTRFEQLVTRSSPKRTIALADDKRPAVTSSIAAMPDIDASDEPEFE